MTITVHNPDRFMSDLRTIVAQGRKRIGLLVGAGAPAGIKKADGTSLIPAIVELTKQTIDKLDGEYSKTLAALKPKVSQPATIEGILSRVRSLSKLIGNEKIDGLDAAGYQELAKRLCNAIGDIVKVELPKSENAFRHIVGWVSGTARDYPIEIFTTNYDLLFEQAFEEARAPYFDGFSGGREPFFDAVTVASDDLPSRWTRLWKLHGSLGWRSNSIGDVIRTGEASSTHLIFPDFLKYDQTQKAPYAALFDRLQQFLSADDALLITTGFSFADAHVSARVEEALASNPSASVFAFQYQKLENEPMAREIGIRRPNFSVYARDRAVINGVTGVWTPGAPLSRDWEPIRATYWDVAQQDGAFTLGDFSNLARFLALSKSGQAFEVPPSEQQPPEPIGNPIAPGPAKPVPPPTIEPELFGNPEAAT
jgi:hypothetical protein